MWRSQKRSALTFAAVALAVVVVVAVAVGALSSRGVQSSGRSPAVLTAGSTAIRHFEYVISDGAIYVYAIGRRMRLVQTIGLPVIGDAIRGVVAVPRSGRLYISYGLQRPPGGSLLAYDLVRRRVLWKRRYRFGVDSIAITRDGRRIYLPAGEATKSGLWRIVSTSDGKPTGRAIEGPAGAHNTIMGPTGRFLYLAGVDYPYLEVASTATGRIVRKLGPLHRPGVRPFTINGSQTLAFTTATSFLGFQVSSIRTGKVLYTVPIPGFSFDPAKFGRTPDHGIALAPDERELYLIDTPNGYVHVFDVSRLPGGRPRLVGNIKLRHAPPNDGWLQTTRDGRYLYVGRSGDVIDTATRKIVSYLPPLQRTADSLEIDWRHGRPVATTDRYSVGYRRHAPAG